jgi:ATP-dependent RNA helicase DDX42
MDPLDAYMLELEQQLQEQSSSVGVVDKPDYEELAADDPIDVFIEQKIKMQREQELLVDEEDEHSEDSEDDNEERNKAVPLLPALDFGAMDLYEFKRVFYQEPAEVCNLDADVLRIALDIKVLGINPPRPIPSFEVLGFPEAVKKALLNAKFENPTPIQAQALPAALLGRDVLGIAKTGSGKTGAYLLPMIIHVAEQIRERGEIPSPVGLVLAPTRELATQIYEEAKKFCKYTKINVAPCFGGMNMHEQTILLQGTNQRDPKCEIVVATPGRLIDHLKKCHTNLKNVSFIALDEADRMLQMGFEPQVRSVVGQIRPDKQCLMFSATFAPKVKILANSFLRNAIHIMVGEIGSSNKDVKQIIEVLPAEHDKWHWVRKRIENLMSNGPLLIFALTKANVEDLAAKISSLGIPVGILHGDKLQSERVDVMHKFKKNEIKVLVATDVAARGLDIKGLDVIINYDLARDIDSHVHRIGRTGRAGKSGLAYTLISKQKPTKLLPLLIENLEEAGQEVPESLLTLAGKSKVSSSSTDGYDNRRPAGSNTGEESASIRAASKRLYNHFVPAQDTTSENNVTKKSRWDT